MLHDLVHTVKLKRDLCLQMSYTVIGKGDTKQCILKKHTKII